MRRGRTIEPRYIKPETICIGDTIRVRWEDEDVEMVRIGKVRRREHLRNETSYETERGIVLVTAFRDGTTSPSNARITLIDRTNEEQVALFAI